MIPFGDLQAFTPIVTMMALFVAQLETPTQRLILSVVAIAIGTAIASYGEINFNLLGVTFMFLSESFESIRLVMTQTLLIGLKFHPSEPFPHTPYTRPDTSSSSVLTAVTVDAASAVFLSTRE